MSRFKKLSHVIWHCQYHIVWVPKYRYRVLKGAVAEEVNTCIQVFCGQLGCEVVEVNVQPECALTGEDTAEGVPIGVHGNGKGSNGDTSFQEISVFEGAPLLGQSLLGRWLLRRHRRS